MILLTNIKQKDLRHNNKMWRKFGVRWHVVLVVLFCRREEEEWRLVLLCMLNSGTRCPIAS